MIEREYDLTAGHWATETLSALALDAILRDLDLWHVHREVPGRLAQPRPCQVDKSVRIDRVLVPTDRLLALGWSFGIVGVEVKRSGAHLGPPLAQALDYTRAVWTLPGGFSVWLGWVFLWPMAPPRGPLESVLVQNRVGVAHASAWTAFQLKCGANLIHVAASGEVRLGDVQSGRKVGSR